VHGLVRGAEIRLLQRGAGPLAGVVVHRGDTRLALGSAEAAAIWVCVAERPNGSASAVRRWTASEIPPLTNLPVALAGNPNVGKSALCSTPSRARASGLGNWPGTTVERREGHARTGARVLRLIDLPAMYSLVPRAPDQQVAIEALFGETPSVVVDVVDASNLERNPYLTVQLLECGQQVVLALNMVDVAARRGLRIDTDALATRLGVPVVPTIAAQRVGAGQIAQACVGVPGRRPEWRMDYGPELEALLRRIEAVVHAAACSLPGPSRWVALTLLEGSGATLRKGTRPSSLDPVIGWAEGLQPRWRAQLGEDPAILLAERRYRYIQALARAVASRPSVPAVPWSDRLDQVLATNGWACRSWAACSCSRSTRSSARAPRPSIGSMRSSAPCGWWWPGRSPAGRSTGGPLRSWMAPCPA